ncbi:MAG: beta-ketoacyl synthase chain length factor [Flavobacteriales bacterium]
MELWINSAVCHPLPWDRDNADVPGTELLTKGAARRMPTQMRKSVCCALKALANAGVSEPDGIFMGTALGQVDDTIGFLDEIETNAGGILSPTGFMRSTHNTVGGTMALLLAADGPNITFSHGLASFHWSLLNATLQAEEHPAHNLLVGAADEHAPLLDALAREAGLGNSVALSAGASFLTVSMTKGTNALGRITGLWPAERNAGAQWWNDEELAEHQPDAVLFGADPFSGVPPILPPNIRSIDYRPFTGTHGSTPGQALCMALRMLNTGWAPDNKESGTTRVLIVDQHGEETSAILVER